jgi:hypothetical protein
MKIVSGLIVSGAMMIAACSSNQIQKVEVEVPALRVSSITNDDSVLLFIQSTGDQNKNLADQYAKKSRSFEQEFIDKAIWNAKRAITLHPTKERYELAASLMLKAKKFNDAVDILGFLIFPSINGKNAAGENENQYLFEKPGSGNYRDFIIASLESQSGYFDNYCMYLSKSQGIDMHDLKSSILKNNQFPLKEGTPAYDNFMLNFLSDAEIESFGKDVRNFDKFISRIPDLQEGFELTKNDLPKFDYRNYNGTAYEDGYTLVALEACFLAENKNDSRHWIRYNTIAKKQLNQKVGLVLYSVDTSANACPMSMRHVYYQLVTYSPLGEIIDSKIVAWQSGVALATARFNGTEITIQEYKRTWKNGYNKYDFDNDLLNTEWSGESKIQVNGDGKILPVDLPASL